MIQFERVSDTKIVVHDGETIIAEFDTTNGMRVNSALKIGTYPITGSILNSAVSGVGQSYKIARGQKTTASASDTVITGLSTVVFATGSLESAPVLTCDRATVQVGDQAGAPAAGSILVKTWMVTAAIDATPIAATTFSKVVNWFAVGT